MTLVFTQTPQQGLIDYSLPFYVPLKNFSLIWRRHHYRWRAAKFRPMLGAQGLWAGKDLYRATPTVTRGLGFSGLVRRMAPFSRLLRHTRGCGGPILTRILSGASKRICIKTSPQLYKMYIVDNRYNVLGLKKCKLLQKANLNQFICKGPLYQVVFYDTQGNAEDLFLSGFHGSPFNEICRMAVLWCKCT
jgi:hypothetical protein